MTANADQLTYWNEVAGPKWVANQARLDRLMAPFTAVLTERAAARPGEAVLDVGCGCGDLALQLAARVGEDGGRVVGIDLSEPMLAHARARAAAATVKAEWLVADAMTYPFEAEFDLVVSRFGVMFFDDRPRAFANLRRALRPGGRFAFVAWRGRAQVEWMQTPLAWLTPVMPMPDNMDGEIGPFGLADGPATCTLLADAGFRDVDREPVDSPLVIGVGVEEAVDMLANTGPAARAMRDLEPELHSRAVGLLREHATSRLVDGRVELGGACWLYTGTT